MNNLNNNDELQDLYLKIDSDNKIPDACFVAVTKRLTNRSSDSAAIQHPQSTATTE